MLKQVECAAAMSSSGLVRPSGFSARDAQVTSKVPVLDESRETLPAPSRSEPSQWAFAIRVVAVAMLASKVSWCAVALHPASDQVAPPPRVEPLATMGHVTADNETAEQTFYEAVGGHETFV